ncbi:MAG: SRPBCC family protein [Actinobacteria bacterium]|nr:SRPBCC family protein [Actinomycetota bacterium]MBU1943090.1 SRPBCC family protein [Actinomycetota bacterium]MBU2687963.1 SRPBCC family protein [Actinomycetota bacterium]
MATLRDSIEIRAPQERIEAWLLEIDRHYAAWHPDHVKWVNLEGELAEGKTFYYEERLKGRLYRSRCRITRLERNGRTYIEFVGLSVPDKILGVSGSFEIVPRGGSCTVTAVINMRFGWFLARLGISGAILAHMEEEGKSLKAIMETGLRT